jgi:epoxyqueuosine reductase
MREIQTLPIDMTSSKNKSFIHKKALELGFDLCGFSKADKLYEDEARLESWLKEGRHGKMSYMENHFDMRLDPRLLVPDAKTVVTLIHNYYPSKKQSPHQPQVAKYAYGEDYHDVIRKKLKSLLQEINLHIGQVEGRGFVDSAPVLERSWALKSGLGWIGKNGNLIHPKKGSYFFIATLIIDLTIDPDPNFSTNHCGTCTKCIDHCPTDAILPNKVVDGSKCISYFTIELRDALLPNNMQGKFNQWLFGCDVCQDVCPWNKFSSPNQEPAFQPLQEIMNMSFEDWDDLTEESFKKVFQHSPIKRTQFNGIKRNLQFIKSHLSDEQSNP